MSRIAAFMLVTFIAIAPARANEIWIPPTHQQDVGGLGVGSNAIWPVTAAGVARLAWAIPDDLQTFQSAKLVLIPQAPAAGATLTLYICRAAGSEMVTANCAGPFTQPFTSAANQLLEIDISPAVAPQVGSAGLNHLAVVAFTTPTIATDRILGLRFAYDPVLPNGAASLAANTFTGTQTAPAFVGNGAGLTNVAKLGANTFTGTQTAPGFVGSGAGLTNLPFPAGAATLGVNTFTGTQTINTGHLDLDASSPSTGNITKNGVLFMHNRRSGTFLGLNAGSSLSAAGSEGVFNTGLGDSALSSTTTGTANTGAGFFALADNTTGVANTGLGHSALRQNVTGTGNTAVGQQSLFSSTGNQNVALGNAAGQFLTNGDNNIYISNFGVSSESNTIRIGVPSGLNQHTRMFMGGIRGITTSQNNAVPVLVDSLGQLGTVSSSRRYKEDIHDMAGASSRLLQLRPVTFRYTQAFADGAKPVQYGLIAEEVAEVFPELVVRDEDGRPETVQYQNLSVLLLNELQKLRRQHASELQRLQARVEELERRLAGGR